jgi:hypothetical protein
VNRPTTGRRPALTVRWLALIALLAAVVLPGCGKKGPPLPPRVRIPARPDQFTARRLGSTVYLQVKVPTANSDGTSPASIERVEIYGFTGSPEGNEGIFKEGMLVASIPVRKPPEGESAEPAKGGSKKGVKPEDKPPAPPRPPPSMENGFDQGDLVVVTEPLGPAQFVEVVPKKKPKAPKVAVPTVKEGPRPLGPAPRAPLPSRLYIAVGISRKGQKGAVSGRQAVLLTEPASAPATPDVTYSETSFTVAWTPPADAYLPAPGTGAGSPLRSTPIGTIPITGAFNVYEARPPVGQASGQVVGQATSLPKVPVPPAAGGRLPTPVNEKPVSASPFVDKRMEFGKVRCYAVRAVTLFATQAIEGEASPVACVTPVDTFAPAPPASLKAVGSEGAISLVWDANTEPDFAGYIVLRASLPGGEFKPVTAEPLKEATFNDATAAKGVRYAYVVIAVDAAGNRSLRSNQVEESAR